MGNLVRSNVLTLTLLKCPFLTNQKFVVVVVGGVGCLNEKLVIGFGPDLTLVMALGLSRSMSKNWET